MFFHICVCVFPCIVAVRTYQCNKISSVYPHVLTHAYFCMCGTLYAIWCLGVSFFSICASHLWRKADPLGWFGSKVIWLKICQLCIWVSVCALQSQIAFPAVGGRLRVSYRKLCVYCVLHVSVARMGVVALASPAGLGRFDQCSYYFSCLDVTKRSHRSGFYALHTQW